jgi:hypothetical protein
MTPALRCPYVIVRYVFLTCAMELSCQIPRPSAIASTTLAPPAVPVVGEQVAPPEAEPISKRLGIALWFPPTVLEHHLGSARHARKRYLYLSLDRRVEAAAPPLEDETRTGLPYEDGSNLDTLTVGEILEYAAAAEAVRLESKNAWRRGGNAEPLIAPPPESGLAREEIERFSGIGPNDRRHAHAPHAITHGAAFVVFEPRRGCARYVP